LSLSVVVDAVGCPTKKANNVFAFDCFGGGC